MKARLFCFYSTKKFGIEQQIDALLPFNEEVGIGRK
jgi:hypothetical protein